MKGKTKKSIVTTSPAETRKIGKMFGEKALLKEEPFFLALYGNLGSGKTTFLKGFATGVGVKDEIASPTFLIYKKYKAERKRTFYHFDAYRIGGEDLSLLNFEEIIRGEDNIVAVEWSENIEEKILPGAVKVYFSTIGPKKRRLIVEGNGGIMNGIFLFGE